jgi:hypothetical protein
MRIVRRIILFGLILLAISLGVWTIAKSSSFEACVVGLPPISIERVFKNWDKFPPIEFNEAVQVLKCGLSVLDQYRDVVRDIAIALIALFTFGLWRSISNLRQDVSNQSETDTVAVGAANKVGAITDKTAITAIASYQTAIEQQFRAYITVRKAVLVRPGHSSTTEPSADNSAQIRTYGLVAILDNNGQTPATNVVINVSSQQLSSPLPETFDFPDSNIFGHGVIGSHSEHRTPVVRVQAPELENLAPSSDWYFWGWVEYNDVLDGPRHRTEFCFLVDRTFRPSTNELVVIFSPYSRFNAIDADCLRLAGTSLSQ